MKYITDYLPPFRYDWIGDINDDADWAVAAMVIYRPRKQLDFDPPSGSYQLFFPPNPWDAMEKVS